MRRIEKRGEYIYSYVFCIHAHCSTHTNASYTRTEFVLYGKQYWPIILKRCSSQIIIFYASLHHEAQLDIDRHQRVANIYIQGNIFHLSFSFRMWKSYLSDSTKRVCVLREVKGGKTQLHLLKVLWTWLMSSHKWSKFTERKLCIRSKL